MSTGLTWLTHAPIDFFNDEVKVEEFFESLGQLAESIIPDAEQTMDAMVDQYEFCLHQYMEHDSDEQCIDCLDTFEFRSGEKRFFYREGLHPPKRCRECRRNRRLFGKNHLF